MLWKILVFDEGTESADIATNQNILSLKISESSSNGSYRNTDEVQMYDEDTKSAGSCDK